LITIGKLLEKDYTMNYWKLTLTYKSCCNCYIEIIILIKVVYKDFSNICVDHIHNVTRITFIYYVVAIVYILCTSKHKCTQTTRLTYVYGQPSHEHI